MPPSARSCNPASDSVLSKLTSSNFCLIRRSVFSQTPVGVPPLRIIYIPQRGVQRKQGVVIYMTLYTSLLYNTTPIHCTPLCRVSKLGVCPLEIRSLSRRIGRSLRRAAHRQVKQHQVTNINKHKQISTNINKYKQT